MAIQSEAQPGPESSLQKKAEDSEESEKEHDGMTDEEKADLNERKWKKRISKPVKRFHHYLREQKINDTSKFRDELKCRPEKTFELLNAVKKAMELTTAELA